MLRYPWHVAIRQSPTRRAICKPRARRRAHLGVIIVAVTAVGTVNTTFNAITTTTLASPPGALAQGQTCIGILLDGSMEGGMPDYDEAARDDLLNMCAETAGE